MLPLLSYLQLYFIIRTIYRADKKQKTCNQKRKRKSTKGQTTIYKTYTWNYKVRVSRTPLKTRGELRCSGRVKSSCSTIGTRRVDLVTNPVINHEWGKDRKVFTTSGTYPGSVVIFHSGKPSHSGDNLKTFEVMPSTLSRGTLDSVASLLAATLYLIIWV